MNRDWASRLIVRPWPPCMHNTRRAVSRNAMTPLKCRRSAPTGNSRPPGTDLPGWTCSMPCLVPDQVAERQGTDHSTSDFQPCGDMRGRAEVGSVRGSGQLQDESGGIRDRVEAELRPHQAIYMDAPIAAPWVHRFDEIAEPTEPPPAAGAPYPGGESCSFGTGLGLVAILPLPWVQGRSRHFCRPLML